MEIEHGIATQRLRLLRLLAGLLVAVAFLSAAPFSTAYRQWLRGFVFSVLTRAEAAAQCLVIAQARILAYQRGVNFEPAQCLHAVGPASDEKMPTLAALRRRISALRAVLNNLPRHGMRLLRRMRGICVEGSGKTRLGFIWDVCDGLGAWRMGADPIERPPDKPLRFVFTAFSLPPVSGREALAVGRAVERIARAD